MGVAAVERGSESPRGKLYHMTSVTGSARAEQGAGSMVSCPSPAKHCREQRKLPMLKTREEQKV